MYSYEIVKIYKMWWYGALLNIMEWYGIVRKVWKSKEGNKRVLNGISSMGGYRVRWFEIVMDGINHEVVSEEMKWLWNNIMRHGFSWRVRDEIVRDIVWQAVATLFNKLLWLSHYLWTPLPIMMKDFMWRGQTDTQSESFGEGRQSIVTELWQLWKLYNRQGRSSKHKF